MGLFQVSKLGTPFFKLCKNLIELRWLGKYMKNIDQQNILQKHHSKYCGQCPFKEGSQQKTIVLLDKFKGKEA
jgi:hypothetical protein